MVAKFAKGVRWSRKARTTKQGGAWRKISSRRRLKSYKNKNYSYRW